MVNVPVLKLRTEESIGLKDLAKIGVWLEVNVKFFLLILSPSNPLKAYIFGELIIPP